MARLRNARNGVIVTVSDERATKLGPDYVPIEVIEAEGVDGEAEAVQEAAEAAEAAEADKDANKPAKGTGKAGK